MSEVKRNENSFEVYDNDKKVGVMNFQENEDGVLNITHTEVDEQFNGQGLGKDLVKAAVDYATENSLKIRSQCPYATHVLDSTTAYQNVLSK